MTDPHASRSPSLADVLDVVKRTDLDEKRRAELASAIRTVGRALNRPLDQIPADAKSLRRRLSVLAPAAVRLSPGRWANVRSHLRAALALARLNKAVRTREPMSAKWRAL